jgi:hypothetical protein
LLVYLVRKLYLVSRRPWPMGLLHGLVQITGFAIDILKLTYSLPRYVYQVP